MALSIEDRIELYELAGRYGDIIDDRDWPALDTVFTSDAVFEVVGLITMTGLADIRRFMIEEGRHPLAHLITNIHIEEATEGVRLLSRGIFPISAEDGGTAHRVFYGSYYDDVVQTPEGWRVRNRVFSAKRLKK